MVKLKKHYKLFICMGEGHLFVSDLMVQGATAQAVVHKQALNEISGILS
jgi:hypothetical protein